MKFVNREAQYHNRKTLNVLDIEYNDTTGEIASLVVDETLNEGSVIEEGTKLNANNLNNAFEDLNRNKFMHFYYKEIYEIDIAEEYYTLDIVGTNPINIEVDTSYYLSLTGVSNPKFNITIYNANSITIVRENNLNVSDSGRIYINVYVSASENTLVTQLNFKYTYAPASTNPED